MSNTNIFQVDYLPEKREIRINLPEEVWDSIDTITLTRLLQEELVVEKVEKQEESEGKEEWFTKFFDVLIGYLLGLSDELMKRWLK